MRRWGGSTRPRADGGSEGAAEGDVVRFRQQGIEAQAAGGAEGRPGSCP